MTVCGELLVKVTFDGKEDPYSDWDVTWCCNKPNPVGWGVRKDGDSQYWQIFGLCYYKEGEKYTLGTKYRSREEDGEFLFCVYDRVGPQHCQILCEGGKFWVTRVQRRGPGTFVNGTSVEWEEKRELKFGDVLSLVVSGYEDNTKKVRGIKAVFKFQKREIDFIDLATVKEWERHEEDCEHGKIIERRESKKAEFEDLFVRDSLGSKLNGRKKKLNKIPVLPKLKGNDKVEQKLMDQVMNNTLILSHIIKRLDFRELKKCRLVCKRWDKEVKIIAKKRDISSDISLVAPSFPLSNGNPLLSLAHEVGDMAKDRKLVVEIPRNREFFNRNFHRKLMDSVEWFFGGGYPYPITNLGIEGPIEEHDLLDPEDDPNIWQRRVWEVILEKTAPTLESLSLEMEMNMTLDGPIPKPFPQHIKFPRLKNVILVPQSPIQGTHWNQEAGMHVPNDDHMKIKEWLVQFIESAPNIENLNLHDSQLIERGFNNLVIRELSQHDRLPNLKILQIPRTHDTILQDLLKLPHKLEGLAINQDSVQGFRVRCEKDTVKDFSLYDKILKKFAPTLDTLCMELPLKNEDLDTIEFPSMPNLKSLTVVGQGGCVGIRFHDPVILDYTKTFPKLETLHVQPGLASMENPRMWMEEEPILDAFFPSEKAQVCTSVRSLYLPYYHLPGDARKKPKVFEGIERIAKMFPNVNNVILSDLRDEEQLRQGRKRKSDVPENWEPKNLRPRRERPAGEAAGRNVRVNRMTVRRARVRCHVHGDLPLPCMVQ